jgi:hypothetical protein
MKDFHSLKVWEKSHRLVLGSTVQAVIFLWRNASLTASYAGLPHPYRRILLKVVVGWEADFSRFLQIAMGSASELNITFFLPTILVISIYQRVELSLNTSLRLRKCLLP